MLDARDYDLLQRYATMFSHFKLPLAYFILLFVIVRMNMFRMYCEYTSHCPYHRREGEKIKKITGVVWKGVQIRHSYYAHLTYLRIYE